jgi:hypothetical protein
VSKRAFGFDEKKHKTNRILGEILAIDWELDTPTHTRKIKENPTRKKKMQSGEIDKDVAKKIAAKNAYYQT